MEEGESKKKKKKKVVSEEAAPLSWQQKKAIADADEEAVGREVEELISWTRMIEAMDDNQLKEYLMNRPEILQQSSRTWKGGSSRKLLRVMQAQKNIKPRSSSSSSQGLMASIWKFHREEEEEEGGGGETAATSKAFQVTR